MTPGQRFTIYGLALDPQGRVRLVSEEREKVVGWRGSKSISQDWCDEHWSNTPAGKREALRRVEELNCRRDGARAARLAHNQENAGCNSRPCNQARTVVHVVAGTPSGVRAGWDDLAAQEGRPS